jgi:N-acetylmuramoyl-L-alanine amidase CwlA
LLKIRHDFVKVNEYSRPGMKVNKMLGVVWHYTASPSATAQRIRDYFNGTCIVNKRHAGAHIAVDWNEALWMIPPTEAAYHAHDQSRCYPVELRPNANFNTIGVEMSIDKNGNLTPETFENAVQVGVILCKEFGFDPMKNFYRHHDITGKNCPAMWVSKPSEFERFKKEVKRRMEVVIKPAVVEKAEPKQTEEEDKLELNSSQWNMVVKNLEEMSGEGKVLSSNEWVVKAKKKELTLSELAFLNLVINGRLYSQEQK